MGLWGEIKKAVKKVAEAIEAFVNHIGDIIGNAIEAIGCTMHDGLNWLDDKIGGKSIFSWLGGIIKGVFSVVSSLIIGVFGIIAGIAGGFIKVVGGIFTGKGSVILEGFWDIFSPIIGTIIVLGGKIIAFVQSVFFAQDFERPLTEEEKLQLKKVFKDELNYYVVRVIEGHCGLFGLSSRAFTLGNTIYLKTNTFGIDLLVHETTHAWQYQRTGNRYTSDAVAAQWVVKDGYNWEKEIVDRNKTNWVEFNVEAQAQFIQDIWKSGELRDIAGNVLERRNGVFFDADNEKNTGYFKVRGTNYSGIADAAIKTIRS
jgi:hypothetical protein